VDTSTIVKAQQDFTRVYDAFVKEKEKNGDKREIYPHQHCGSSSIYKTTKRINRKNRKVDTLGVLEIVWFVT